MPEMVLPPMLYAWLKQEVNNLFQEVLTGYFFEYEFYRICLICHHKPDKFEKLPYQASFFYLAEHLSGALNLLL